MAKANSGYYAVRVVPVLAAGVFLVAMITLIKVKDTKDVFERQSRWLWSG
jgi:hypothetical protein